MPRCRCRRASHRRLYLEEPSRPFLTAARYSRRALAAAETSARMSNSVSAYVENAERLTQAEAGERASSIVALTAWRPLGRAANKGGDDHMESDDRRDGWNKIKR